MDASRSDPEFLAEVLGIAVEAGATTINIPDTVGLRAAARVRRLHPRALPALPGAARRRRELPLPRRPRAGGGQLARRGARRRDAGRVRRQRHRRARRQRLARRGRHGDPHARRLLRRRDRGQDRGDRPHQPAGLERHRLRGPAQQGDRRAQRVRPRVGHPPGRHPQGGLDLRDHDAPPTSASPRATSCSASTAAGTPCARGSPSSATSSRTRSSTRPSAASRTWPTRRRRSRSSTSRPWSARRSASARTTSRCAASSASRARRSSRPRRSRSTCAASCGTARASPTARVESVFKAIDDAVKMKGSLADYQVRAISEGKDALAEVRVAVVVDGETYNGQAVELRRDGSVRQGLRESAEQRRRRAGAGAPAGARGDDREGTADGTDDHREDPRPRGGARRGRARATSSRRGSTSRWPTTSPRRWRSPSSRTPGSTRCSTRRGSPSCPTTSRPTRTSRRPARSRRCASSRASTASRTSSRPAASASST